MRVVGAKVVKIRVWVCSVSCRSGGSVVNFKDVIDLQCFVRINWTNLLENIRFITSPTMHRALAECSGVLTQLI